MANYKKSDVDLVYKDTSSNYKSIINGKKYVMWFDPKDGTVLGPINSMPKNIFESRLNTAKNRKSSKK